MCRAWSAPGKGGVELADIVAAWWAARESHEPALAGVQYRALEAILACRTARMGGFAVRCDHCGAIQVHYCSCRNRHCPKCQALAKERWIQARLDELLPVPYFHFVFTLPHRLNSLAQGNPKTIYDLLFHCAAETLQDFGRNPKWLGGEIGVTMVLHTWGQTLSQHIHVHCLVTGGALTDDGHWLPAKPGFLFPVNALSRVFRGKFIAGLKKVRTDSLLHFAGEQANLGEATAFEQYLRELSNKDWVVYAKRPFAGPQQVIDYLGRYTHRIAISNHRLIDLIDDHVRFYWRDYAHGNKRKIMTLQVEEFMRRFLLHILPAGFMRIRHYGLLANRCKKECLQRCRMSLQAPAPEPQEPETVEAFILRVLGLDIHRCPICHVGLLKPFLFLPKATGPP
jgi:hypothetical protein